MYSYRWEERPGEHQSLLNPKGFGKNKAERFKRSETKNVSALEVMENPMSSPRAPSKHEHGHFLTILACSYLPWYI